MSLGGFCFNQEVVDTYDMLGINYNSLNSFETCCLEQIIFSFVACFICARLNKFEVARLYFCLSPHEKIKLKLIMN